MQNANSAKIAVAFLKYSGVKVIEKLNAFLKFSEYEILTNTGKISHEVAESLALEEYEKYRKIQDRNYISDFDREVKKILKMEKKK